MLNKKIVRISLITSLLISSNLLAGDEYLTQAFGSMWSVNNNGNYIATNVADITTIQVEDIDSNVTKKDSNANLSVYDINGTLKNSSDNLAKGDYLDINNSGVGRRYSLFGIQNQIAGGENHTLVLIEGKVYSFGDGTYGQLGHGDTDNQISPKQIEVAGENNITVIAVGDNHSLMLDRDGKVYSFGYGTYGQLGHGDTDNQISPKQIEVAGENNITTISTGSNHSLLLNKNGKVYTFGKGIDGQLGDGNKDSLTSPKQIEVAGRKSITAISAGGFHSILLDKDGTVYTFGNGSSGQLGHGSIEEQIVPTAIKVIDKNNNTAIITTISAGYNHSLVLSKDGKVYSFGRGIYGQLGHGEDTSNQFSPKQIEVAGENNITAIVAGTDHTLLLGKDGKVYSFGIGSYGQLGHGDDLSDQISPKQIEVASENNITTMSGGSFHSLLLDKNGKVYSFGDGTDGRLGYGDAYQQTLPKLVIFNSSPIAPKVDFNSSIITAGSWNMISVPDERSVSVSNISGATIWTFNNSANAWKKPTTLIAGKGYFLYTTSSIGLVSADKVTSTITSDYTTIKNIENNNTWTLVGISKSTTGVNWSDIYNPKNDCSHTQIFYFDSVNGSWNTSTNIPYQAGIWVKQNCTNNIN